MSDIAGAGVGGAIGGGFVRRLRQRRAQRARTDSALECAFRDRSGATSKLMRRWRHGYAEVAPGRVLFSPYIALGVRMRRPFTDPIEVQIHAVDGAARGTTGLEVLFFAGLVYSADTPSGAVEWGHASPTDAWAIEAVLADPADV